MNKVLNDYKTFLKVMGELNYLADCGQSYENMYYGHIDYLNNLCNRYNVPFDESKIDWKWCNYIFEKESEVEQKMEILLGLRR